MADEGQYQYPYPADVVFAAALNVLTFGAMHLISADPTARLLHASTSLNLATYGERISVQIFPTGPATSRVDIRSQLKFGIADPYKHNRKNVALIHASLQYYVSVVAPGTPGWYGDPYGHLQSRYFDGTHFLDQNNAPMIASVPTATPAGWYPDPQVPTLQRYWDGQKWTENTAPQ
ncbi:MAG: DUF2510 domain-containing protein [Candidatus Nanopelagicales bacterium]